VWTLGTLLPFSPAAPWLGFAPLPLPFFAFLVVMVLAYLLVVEVAKRRFYRSHGM
jgi:P-type Mg2+ transporter